jgi:hypothetical protein
VVKTVLRKGPGDPDPDNLLRHFYPRSNDTRK